MFESIGNGYRGFELQRSLDVMLLQQSVHPVFRFLRRLGQARGTLQLTLANLLDVNLIGSLVGSLQWDNEQSEKPHTSARRRVLNPAQDSAKN